MYELSRTVDLETSTSCTTNNLSTYYCEETSTTYACIAYRNQVNIVKWETKEAKGTKSHGDIYEIKPEGDLKRATIVVQAKLCPVTQRTFPLLVVGCSTHVAIYDPQTKKLLCSVSIRETKQSAKLHFACGLSYVESTVFAGTSSGEILVFNCSGETIVQHKATLTAHSAPITDIATCIFDSLTCSSDATGLVVVWSKSQKVSKQISTKYRNLCVPISHDVFSQSISCLNVLRKQAICGTHFGQVLFYSTQTGELMAEVSAHARPLYSISVAPESAYVLTASEDTFVRVWKLHTRKPEPFQVEWRFSISVPDFPIVGAQFTNGRGSQFAISAYDSNKINVFRIAKKTAQ
uniref:WD_REPEATS_REGION domain-containing protein n=1 Tax=Steinernema glaseri TaxID=37863 RepID=A0A1I7Z477_9BILA